ncbi:MAG: shikimate kinase [Ghiorsea sp.]|nr:shikimate kinase [Ghiorsea sp.]
MDYNIMLVGLMGSGQSILGKQLASRLSLDFIDLDDRIVKYAGKPIPDIFEQDGEMAFRTLESSMLEQALLPEDGKASVLATGGGTVLSRGNRELMQKCGQVIWLDASPTELARRISGDENRPLLNGVDPLFKMISLATQRNALYAEVADLRVDTEALNDEESIAKMIDFLSE